MLLKFCLNHQNRIIRCTSMKCEFFPKKYVKVGRTMKSALFKVCSIVCYTFSPSFGQFENTTLVKIFPLCYELFVSHFFTSSYEQKRRSASA